MDVIASSEIVHKVQSYISGRLSLEELEDWVMQRVEYFFELPSSDANELVGIVIGGLAEISLGHRSEGDFRAILKEQLERETISVFVFPPRLSETITSSTSSTPIPCATLGAAGVPSLSSRQL